MSYLPVGPDKTPMVEEAVDDTVALMEDIDHMEEHEDDEKTSDFEDAE